MRLETARLVIEHLTTADAEFILALLNDEAFIANVGDKQVRTKEQAIQYLEDVLIRSYRQYGFGSYKVCEKSTGELIGTCGLLKRENLPDADIGYAFLPTARGKGYGFEASKRVLQHAVEDFGLRRIVALIAPHNRGSIRLVEKLGLSYERLYRMPSEEESICLYGGFIA